MPGLAPLRHLLVTMALCLLAGLFAVPAAQAQQLVSIKGSTVNMRAGPGTQTEVLWELSRGYPLKVVGRKGNWLQVRDFENDRGWVARSLVTHTPHHIVKARVANVRKAPGTGHPVIGKVEYGEVLRTRAKRAGWVRVERDNGQVGWVSKGLLWGW